ncbi:Putative lipoprotein thiredoxin [hydrothermal vent metagenome]|uniref:Putative lipoprotein thiredoxin n=1 Tax=hydrothermal vent metagenome TaxID=652676 RepID=A0A1W1EA88_9ZZZZ
MRQFPAGVFIVILFAVVAILSGCDKKEQKENPFNQHAAKTLTKTASEHAVSSKNSETFPKPTLQTIQNRLEENATIQHPSTEETYTLKSLTGEQKHVSVESLQVVFKDISQPVVIVYLFAPWSLPCQGEVPYLSELQKKYAKDLYVLGILLNPKKYTQTLGTFIQTHHANFYISVSKQNNPLAKKLLSPLGLSDTVMIPMTVIYQNGHYWRHYTGAVPIEMIEHDLKTILD